MPFILGTEDNVQYYQYFHDGPPSRRYYFSEKKGKNALMKVVKYAYKVQDIDYKGRERKVLKSYKKSKKQIKKERGKEVKREEKKRGKALEQKQKDRLLINDLPEPEPLNCTLNFADLLG